MIIGRKFLIYSVVNIGRIPEARVDVMEDIDDDINNTNTNKLTAFGALQKKVSV